MSPSGHRGTLKCTVAVVFTPQEVAPPESALLPPTSRELPLTAVQHTPAVRRHQQPILLLGTADLGRTF